MLIKAALFDLDGTLLDTQKIYDEVNQKLINEYGNGKIYDFDTKKKILGTTSNISGNILINTFNICLSNQKFNELKNQFLVEPFKNCTPMPGAKELTHVLKHKYGLKIAVATSSRKSNVEYKLCKHKKWFESDVDILITGDDKRIKNSKPASDIFLLAAKELGVEPKECIVFEDAVNGIEAGLNSGAAVVVGIPDPHFKQDIDKLLYDKSKTHLYILDSLKDFDYSFINFLPVQK